MGTSMRAASWRTGAVRAAGPAARAPARAREVVRQSDSRIKAQVEEALKADETLSGSRIFVRSVKDGVVLLGGKAKTPTDDLRAMGDAARVPGVRRITSEIGSPDRPADEETSRQRESTESARVAAARDMWITLATKLRLVADKRTPALDVSVDAHDGAVTLFGMVPSAEARAAAEENAWRARGVKRVVKPAPGGSAVEAGGREGARRARRARGEKGARKPPGAERRAHRRRREERRRTPHRHRADRAAAPHRRTRRTLGDGPQVGP